MSRFTSMSPVRALSLLAASTVLAAAACGGSVVTESNDGPAGGAAVFTPTGDGCDTKAIGQIGQDYSISFRDPHPIVVDATGVLLDLGGILNASSALVSGSATGGFSTLFTPPAGTTLVHIRTNGDLIVVAIEDGAKTYALDSMLRNGQDVLPLGNLPSAPRDLAVGADTIFVASDTGIAAMPIRGGTLTPLVAGGRVTSMALDGASLYWVQLTAGALPTGAEDGGATSFTFTLFVASVDDGLASPQSLATLPSNEYPLNLAESEGTVYLSASGRAPEGAIHQSLYTLADGSLTRVDNIDLPPDVAATDPMPLAVTSAGVWYSLSGNLQSFEAQKAVTIPVIGGVLALGADPSPAGTSDVVYVSGICVYALPTRPASP